MNKKFYFALALTAGLFASCSSDDFVSQAPGADIQIDDNEAAVIKVGVKNAGLTTRGTGSVGYPDNKWAGQTFNIFMFKTGTFVPAQYRATEESELQDIYNNTVLTTNADEQVAEYKVDGVTQYNYFPGDGTYDFWAYRADDAAGEPVGVGSAESDEATQVEIPVTIDGSQDLMLAITDTETSLASLTEQVGAEKAAGKIYSAYAARRNVNPILGFKHLLTRLSFKVKASDRSVSNVADKKTTDENEQIGFSVTGVRVWSKATGKIIAAYKGEAPAERLVWNEGQNWDDLSTLTPFSLKSRESNPEKADIVMRAINPDGGIDLTMAGYKVNGSIATFNTSTADDATVVYTYTSASDVYTDPETGELTATEEQKTTLGEVKAMSTVPNRVWIAWVKDGFHSDGVTTWDKATETSDASSQLVDLIPVTPKWEGYVAAGNEMAWSEKTPVATAYNWTETGTVASPTIDATTAPTTSTTGAVNDTYKYTDPETGDKFYYQLTSITYDTNGATLYEGATNPVDDEATGTTDGQIVYVVTTPDDPETVEDETTKTYYVYAYVGSENADPGHAVATPVGEALLVAPADANGYQVEFTYTRSKKITGTHVEPMTGSVTINVKAGEGFEAGKSYTITAVLYPDGEISTGTITPDPWEEENTDQPEWDLEQQ
jgi:hypothetical protein